MTQQWQYKGKIQPPEQATTSRQVVNGKDTNEVQEGISERGKQTPKTRKSLPQPQTEGTYITLNLANFPVLATIPTKNGFECLRNSKLATLPMDRGGAPNTC